MTKNKNNKIGSSGIKKKAERVSKRLNRRAP
jgi:hypothetical protein